MPVERPSRPCRSRLVPAAMFVPGLGSNVSNWLGPPPIQRTMTDFAGVRSFSAARARAVPRGVSHDKPAAPAAARKPRRWKWEEQGAIRRTFEIRARRQLYPDRAGGVSTGRLDGNGEVMCPESSIWVLFPGAKFDAWRMDGYASASAEMEHGLLRS